jgi:transposase
VAPDQWRCIGEEVSEQLDYEPARFLRRRLVRRKYVSKIDPDTAPVIAELPAMLRQRSAVAAGLLAQIIVSKFCDHLPLYRQEQSYWTRHRVWLPRQNLAHWMEVAADWLKPIYQHIRTGVMAGGYLHYVLDLWVARERKRSGCGEVIMVRYADDFIIGFEHKEDAERFLTQLRSLPRPVEAVTDRVRWCPRPGSDDRVGNQSQRLVLKPLQSGAICDSPFHGGSGDAQSGAQPGASVQAAPSKAQSV